MAFIVIMLEFKGPAKRLVLRDLGGEEGQHTKARPAATTPPKIPPETTLATAPEPVPVVVGAEVVVVVELVPFRAEVGAAAEGEAEGMTLELWWVAT